MENDLEFLREQLSQLDEPELPPTLTAEALFARLDEGALTLPEETPEEEKTKATVIPWGKIAKRWVPLAACLALVLLLHRGYQVGMARNFTSGTTSFQTADSAAPAAEVPESAAYNQEDEGAIPEEDATADFSAYDSASDSVPQESLSRQKSVNGPVSSAAAAPAPEPGAAPDEVKGFPSEPSIGGSDGSNSSGSNEDSSEEPKPAPTPSPTPDGGSNTPSSSPDDDRNPPTGGGNLHPDVGGPGDANPDVGTVEPSTPPRFDLDSGGNAPAAYQNIVDQMKYIAAWHTIGEGLDIRLTDLKVTEDDVLVFTALYIDENKVVQGRIIFYCYYCEGKGESWLEMIDCEAITP